ncbi:MAG: hypothetical protein ACOYMW_00965 [Candidatus Competibacteraceae bacterium]
MKIAINKYNTLIESVILFGVCILYFQLINRITFNYHPVWSDEFFYFINSSSFVQNNTLNAALTFSGEGAMIFGADAHGFGYPLLHGIIAKILGWSNLNFIILNFILILISILIILILKGISISQKLSISIFILLFPFIPIYAFTYMQEVIHVFISILLSALIYIVYKKNNNSVYIILFILTIIISGIFRSLWFFWLIGLIPLAKNKKQAIFYCLLFLFGIVLSFIFTKLFSDPIYNNYFSSVLYLLETGKIKNMIFSLTHHFFNNIFLYFFSIKNNVSIEVVTIYIFMKYATISLVGFFIFIAFRKKSPLYIALSLIGTVNFLLLFLLYDAFEWREIRTMSPLFYFYSLFIVLETKGFSRYIQVGCLLIIFSLTFKTSIQGITERNTVNLQAINKEKIAYNEISEKVKNNAIIFMNYTPKDYSWDLLNLPLHNINNSQIKYIIQYVKQEKTKYDYTLMRPSKETLSNKIIDNEYFILLKQ